MSLIRKICKGAFWNSLSQFGSQGVNFVVLVLLARLLGPQDFGLVGMVTAINAFFYYFSECGLTVGLIQRADINETDCQTVFWSTFFFGGIIFLVGFLIAPLAALFYHDDRLTLIMRVLFLDFLIAPFAFISETLEVKKLLYGKITAANLIGISLSGIFGVWLAFAGFGVWSLVVQQLSMTFFRTVTLLTVSRWRPKPIFSWTRFKAMSSFGSHFTIRNLILYFSENVDLLMVGKLLGPAAVGIYSLALRIAKYPITKLWYIFGEMLFPAFVSFREDRERVKKNFVKVSLGGGLALSPLLVCLFFGIRPLIELLVGEQWLSAVPVVQVLTVGFLFDSVFLCDESLMIAFAELKKINAVKAATTLLLSVAGYFSIVRWGVTGMAVVFACVMVLHVLLVKSLVLRHLGLGAGEYLRKLKPVFVWIVLLGTVFGVYARVAAGFLSPLLFLCGEGTITSLIYAGMVYQYGLIDLKEKKINLDHLAGG